MRLCPTPCPTSPEFPISVSVPIGCQNSNEKREAGDSRPRGEGADVAMYTHKVAEGRAEGLLAMQTGRGFGSHRVRGSQMPQIQMFMIVCSL
jgi:hypothetical protein